MRVEKVAAAAAALALLVPASAPAQIVELTPKIGGYFRAASVNQIEDEAGSSFSFERKEVSTLALGANVEIDLPASPIGVRGDVSVATDTDASLTGSGDGDSEELESALVAVSGGLVLRPLSFLPLVDPYLTGGAGFTSTDYDSESVDELPSDRSFALHAGIGSDLELGGLRIQGEVADYVTGISDEGEVTHEVFVTAGLGFSLF